MSSKPVGLGDYIAQRRRSRQLLLMTHVIVGYPSLEANWRMLEIMAAADVDLVELQMPFSEPVADGPTFVRANQHALQKGLKVAQYLELMKRSTSTFSFPHLWMGYYNTVYKMGHERFCSALKENGASGHILPDLPFEEYGDLFELSRRNNLSPIMLMTPTNTDERLHAIGENASGFVYTVARKGVTGKKTALAEDLFGFLERCRLATDLPLALGFGLRTGQDLSDLHGVAEIAVVGSVLLDAWETGGESAYRDLVNELSEHR